MSVKIQKPKLLIVEGRDEQFCSKPLCGIILASPIFRSCPSVGRRF